MLIMKRQLYEVGFKAKEALGPVIGEKAVA